MGVDGDLLKKYTLATWGFKQGETVSLMINLGVRLGIYSALDGAGAVTASDLAAATGLHERWLKEWLRAQAAAGLLVSDDGEAFLLEDEAAMVLARTDTPTYAGGVFSHIRHPRVADGLEEAFRTGLGLTYDGQGEGSEHHVEAMLAPMARALLVPTVIPALDEVTARLKAGAKVVDIGCGTGLVLQLMAEAWPDSTYEGYDISERAVAVARERFTDVDNVTVHLAGGEDVPSTADADLVMTMDCLHDMPRPDLAMAAIRGVIAAEGTWLVKEIKSSPEWSMNLRNPMLAMMYSTSVASCMSSAMSTPDGLGLGTLGLDPATLEAMATEAGFTRFTMHDLGDPTNLYYEIRP
ncbi:MAG: methyltransferase domain-containing protein [Acidimicrobiales bacterium]|jgi:ubiquinone/menaquinone biosynthesis C-methylase UbiE|nr:methyltransferase domain-containing protein [Acidimicrobiales bacterium]